jgi:hypothetical protein
VDYFHEVDARVNLFPVLVCDRVEADSQHDHDDCVADCRLVLICGDGRIAFG